MLNRKRLATDNATRDFSVMFNFIALALLLLTIVLSTGGGLFEILVVYPNWMHSKNGAELKERLQSSGQNYAGTRFWPLVSPLQALLSIINIVMAWRFAGQAHGLKPSLVFSK